MVNYEKDGLVLALNTEDMSYLEFFNLFQPNLDAEELKSIMPNLGQYGISADDVEATIALKNKIWDVLTVLVENGLSIKAVCHWYDTDHVGSCKDLNWLFSAYLKCGISPDQLAREFSGFFSRGLLNEKKNVEVLLKLGVAADTLVRDVLTREQITKHFNLLYSEGASIDLIINTIGVFPKFYETYPVNYLNELHADLLRVSEYIFYPTQPYLDTEKYLSALAQCDLNLTEFVSQVVVAKNLNLHVVVQFPKFFADRYVDVRSVLKDVCSFKTVKKPRRRDMENKLIILANFSKLASMGFIDEPKKVKKDWKWGFDQVQRSIFGVVYDSQGYSFNYLLDVPGFEYAEEKGSDNGITSASLEGIIDDEVPDFLKEPKRRIARLELPVDPFNRVDLGTRVPEAAPSVIER